MKIAIIGSGNIGGALAKRWGAAGHQIMLGVRDTDKSQVRELVEGIGPNARASSIPEAVAEADAVLFAVPGAAMADTVPVLAESLAGKVVFDATNNIGAAVVNSVAAIASAAPGASVYRAFNTYGWENFANPEFDSVPADLFYAGPEGEAQATAEQLIADVGLRPIRLGGPDKAELVDALLRVWFALAIDQKLGRQLAFKVLTRRS